MQYAIHEDFFPEVEKKLNRIAKKCARFGNDFVFEVVGEEMRITKKKTGLGSFIGNHIDFVREFVQYRGDVLSSDREVVAFMFALDDMVA